LTAGRDAGSSCMMEWRGTQSGSLGTFLLCQRGHFYFAATAPHPGNPSSLAFEHLSFVPPAGQGNNGYEHQQARIRSLMGSAPLLRQALRCIKSYPCFCVYPVPMWKKSCLGRFCSRRHCSARRVPICFGKPALSKTQIRIFFRRRFVDCQPLRGAAVRLTSGPGLENRSVLFA